MSSGTEQAVRSFLRFALSKRRAQLREVEIAAEEVASAKARTGMAVFNAQDVQDVIAEVKVAVKRAAERELVDLAHNSALLLRLCLDELSDDCAWSETVQRLLFYVCMSVLCMYVCACTHACMHLCMYVFM